jgi:hypothetical protein
MYNHYNRCSNQESPLTELGKQPYPIPVKAMLVAKYVENGLMVLQ